MVGASDCTRILSEMLARPATKVNQLLDDRINGLDAISAAGKAARKAGERRQMLQERQALLRANRWNSHLDAETWRSLVDNLPKEIAETLIADLNRARDRLGRAWGSEASIITKYVAGQAAHTVARHRSLVSLALAMILRRKPSAIHAMWDSMLVCRVRLSSKWSI